MNSIFSLHNKNIVITGGAGILGAEISCGLAASGASLAIIDKSEKDLIKQKRALQNTYPNSKINVYVCDIASTQQVIKTVSRIIEDFSRIDVLFNNAASKGDNLAEFFASPEECTIENWRQISSVNIEGMFLMSQAVGKHMISSGNTGSIIQTASIYGVVAPDKRIYEGSNYLGQQISSPAVYTATKSAVIGLTKYLCAHWGDKGIRVNSLTPGGVESGQNTTFTDKYSNRVPLGRMAKASEMVGPAIFLASDASSYITGHNLIVDGGLSAW